jgi:hypothetical protein
MDNNTNYVYLFIFLFVFMISISSIIYLCWRSTRDNIEIEEVFYVLSEQQNLYNNSSHIDDDETKAETVINEL